MFISENKLINFVKKLNLIYKDVTRKTTVRSYKETDERVYGMVQGSAAENGARQPKDAQLRNIKKARRGVEIAH